MTMLVHNEEDFKYIMQDFEKYYFGARYTYQEIIDSNLIPFKFKIMIERYIARNIDKDTTLESHFYYMTKESEGYKCLKLLRTRVRVSELATCGLLQKKERYVERIIPVEKLVKMDIEEKKEKAIVIREILISKMSLMVFQV